MAAKAAPRTPAQMPSDLVPRSMLPDRPTIPEWQSFGYGAPAPKPKAAAKAKGKKHGGAIHSSASRRADGIARKGKTRGKMC